LLRIRFMRATDFRSIIKLTNEEHWGFGIRDLRRIRALEPRGCLVAPLDGRPAGLTTAISYGRGLGWIGNVVVARTHRNEGIGSSLVQAAIRYLIRSHVRSIGLYCYPENKSMYERLGFRTIGGFVRLSISRRTRRRVAENRQVPFREILRIDRRAFGADRTRLLRRLLDEFPRSWTWTLDGSLVSGYAVVKPYQDSSEIGPSVCEHMNEDAIRTLLESSLDLVRKWPTEMSIPESNQTVLETALRLGFRVQRKGFVMNLAGRDRICISPAVAVLGFLDKG
jgi:predicted N-acetyltransferase YhbS